jgi:2-oxoglutarate dehydrogenase complex dehydrogenase (E1) component-like enzyme
MPKDLTQFFETYRDAFNSLQGNAVAELYAEPSGIAQGGVYTHWPDRVPVIENMNALCDLYRKKGYVRADFEPIAYVNQGDQHAIADLRWRIEWNDGQEPWQFNTTYNVVHTNQGWRVLLCTAYTEDKLFKVTSAA